MAFQQSIHYFMYRFKDTTKHRPFRHCNRFNICLVLSSGWGRGSVKRLSGLTWYKLFKTYGVCFLFYYCNYPDGHVKMYLEVLCIMVGLELPSLATNGYTKGLIGSCHNPDATNIAIWKTRPAYPLIDVWTIKLFSAIRTFSWILSMLTQLFIDTVNPQLAEGSRRVIYLVAWAFGKKKILVIW